MATWPGTPMMFAGDEFGLDGRYAEDSRRPMPWHRPASEVAPLHDLYRNFFALRDAHAALREGGLRVLHADADGLTFLRETADQQLLVRAVRAACREPINLPLSGPAIGVYAAPDARAGGALTLPPTDGPALQIWQLDPGRRP
jgi:alpha-glucosidase